MPFGGQQIAAKHPADRAFSRRICPARIAPSNIKRPRTIAQRAAPADHGDGLVRFIIAVAGECRLGIVARLDQNPIGRARRVACRESRMDRPLGIGEITVLRAQATVAIIAGGAIHMQRRAGPNPGIDQITRFYRRLIGRADLFNVEIKAHAVPTKPRRKGDRYPVTVRRKWAQTDPQHQINPLMPDAVVPVASTRAIRRG